MLWLLQPVTPGRIQQKVFSEDDSTGLQGQPLLVRERKSTDDLVDGVLSGPSACYRYLHIFDMLEPRNGNVREGDCAKEVQIGLG